MLRVQARSEKTIMDLREKVVGKLSKMAAVSLQKERTTTAMLLDLDEYVEEKQVREAVVEELRIKDAEDIKVRLGSSVNKAGMRVAFVTGRTENVQRLIDAKRIGKGWHRWRVKEQVEIPRCFKCRRIGHIAKECDGVDGEVCYRCGGTGHRMGECTNAKACYLCNSEGHSAGGADCGVYKG